MSQARQPALPQVQESSVPATIAILLNQQAVEVAPPATLADLLAQQGLDPATHATAVNGIFVARAARAQRHLQPGDVVTCFQAIVGG